jgi:hypothetical protein
MKGRYWVASIALLLLLGCANGYQQFYTDLLKGQPITSSRYLIPSYGQPEVYRGTDPDTDSVAMLENGYSLIGYSSFNGAVSPQNNPTAQAKTVHAAVVLVYGRFSNTVTGSIPYTVYTPGKVVTTTSNGSIYDPSGVTNYSGTSTTYLPGSSTTYQNEYRVDRYDQSASFWVRSKPSRLGIIQRDLTPDERQRYQRNRGAVAIAIIKSSPAFMADLLRGDVLLRLGDDDVIDAASYTHLLDKYEGRDTEIVFLRNGEQHTKVVHLNRTE